MSIHHDSAESLVDLLIGNHSSLVGDEHDVLECQRQRVIIGFTFPPLPW